MSRATPSSLCLIASLFAIGRNLGSDAATVPGTNAFGHVFAGLGRRNAGRSRISNHSWMDLHHVFNISCCEGFHFRGYQTLHMLHSFTFTIQYSSFRHISPEAMVHRFRYYSDLPYLVLSVKPGVRTCPHVLSSSLSLIFRLKESENTRRISWPKLMRLYSTHARAFSILLSAGTNHEWVSLPHLSCVRADCVPCLVAGPRTGLQSIRVCGTLDILAAHARALPSLGWADLNAPLS